MPSLADELRSPRTPLREYLESTFPNVKPILAAWTRPDLLVPPPEVAPYARGRIGVAFDYRLRLAHGPLPRADTAAHYGWQRIDRAALRQRREQRGVTIAAQKARRAAFVSRGEDPVSQIVTAIEGITGGERRAFDALTTHEDARLAALCWLLALYEECWRSRRLPPDHPLVVLGAHPSWDDLVHLFPDQVIIDDLTALGRVTADVVPEIVRGAADCNPVFNVPGLSADGDIVVDGCLWEIKTTNRSGFDRRVLYQLVAYCLLDRANRFDLREAGLLRVRFGAVQKWPLLALLEQLANRPVNLQEARDEFASVLMAAYTRRGPRRTRGH